MVAKKDKKKGKKPGRVKAKALKKSDQELTTDELRGVRGGEQGTGLFKLQQAVNRDSEQFQALTNIQKK